MGHMSEKKIDKIDIQLLSRVAELSGSNVTRIVKTLDCRTVHTLRYRLDRLESFGYVHLDRATYRGRVQVFITESGKAAISGWVESPSAEEASV